MTSANQDNSSDDFESPNQNSSSESLRWRFNVSSSSSSLISSDGLLEIEKHLINFNCRWQGQR